MRVSHLAWLGLIRRPVAAALTVIGIGLITALGGVVSRVNQEYEQQIHRVDPSVDILIAPKASVLGHYLAAMALRGAPPTDLVRARSALEALEEEVHPYHVMPVAWFGRVQDLPVFGVTKAWWTRPASMASPMLAKGRRPNADDEIVLGATAAKELGLRKGDQVTVQALWSRQDDDRPVWTGTFTVVGVLTPLGHAWDRALLTTRESARPVYRAAHQHRQLPAAHDDGVSHLLVRLGPNAAASRSALFETFHVRRVEQVVDVARAKAELRSWLQSSRRMQSLLLATLGLMGIGMLGGLLAERQHTLRKHLLMLRAMGYLRWDLAALLWLQGVALLVTGAVLGLTLEVAVEVPLLSSLHLPVPSSWWPTPGHCALWFTLFSAVFVAGLTPWFWQVKGLR